VTGLSDSRYPAYPKYKLPGVDWMGKIPAHWEVVPIKYLARLRSGDSITALDINENDPYPVYGGHGIRGFTSAFTHEGEFVLIGRQGALCGNVEYARGKFWASEHAVVAHPLQCYRLLWFGELLRTMNLNQYSISAAQPGLAVEKIQNLKIPVPPLSEQRAIATFLDHQTTHFDALIAEQHHLIELLQEKRAALISHAVTKGLDPTVPMKDSGIKWLGEIPAHWEIAQLRRVVTKFVDYRGRTPEKVESGVPLITARNIKNGHIDFSLSTEYMREDEYEDWMVRGRPEIGDVLVTTEAPLGETAQITDTRIALAQRIILLKVNTLRMINGYLKYHFLSAFGQGELWSRATGSTAVGIRADRFKDSLVTVPPLEEQAKIVHLLNNKIAILERPLRKIEQSVERLHEYRAALISAAVTGKIDVRDEQMQCD
jgi:type I restriction enzyme S subunit